MTPGTLNWWKAVQALADFAAHGMDCNEILDEWVFKALADGGFTEDEIDEAIMWLEMAAHTSNLNDLFSMVHHGYDQDCHRVRSPLESATITTPVWERIQNMRTKGIISNDHAERLVEGVRALDTRDWEEEDLDGFVEDILSSSMPNTPIRVLKRLKRSSTKLTDFYS